MNIKKIAGFSVLGLFLVLVCIYSGLWFYAANTIKQELRPYYTEDNNLSIQIIGEFPTIGGFPGPHTLEARDTIIKSQYGSVSLPSVSARGFPIPNHSLTIELSDGINFESDTDDETYRVDYLYLKGPIPNDFPQRFTVESLRQWQARQGTFVIDQLKLKESELKIEGNGTVGLNQDLQLDMNLDARVQGYMDYLGTLQDRDLIDNKQGFMASAVLSGLTQEDSETGVRYIKANVRIQNQRFLIGPITIFTIPTIYWPYDSDLDQ